jgi:RNA polymerase sigma-70 factor (ECF subfamily)
MPQPELPTQIRAATRAAWHRYIDFLTPFRPELYRYCRRLTGDVWDAEDLVQDTILRGFGVMNHVHRTIDNPRGYLIRIAANLWMDSIRHRTSAAHALALENNAVRVDTATKPDPLATREAAARLIQLLTPQERAAIVLKEVFDMSLDEIAQMLATSVGAVKAALHRGRTTLAESSDARPSPRPIPSAALVERFVDRLNASDLPALLAMMLDSATIEMPGNLVEVGRKEFESKGSWLWHAVHVHPDLPPEMRPPKFVNERATYEGEPMMLGFMIHGATKLLMAVARFEEEAGRISKIRAYNFSPEVIQEVGAALGLPAGVVPYQFPA